MVRNELISRYVALALMGAASTAFAQTAPAPDKSSDELQEIVVTGTLIKRADAESAEAITILKADSLKDIGIQNVEQALGMLTSNTPSINIASAVGTFSGGGTYANLRNLGNGRTLILLDGQRLANNANTGNAVDLSGIPFSAIDQIEVLREGASALYGADAVAGVINFITKKNYQGAEISGNFDKTQHGGGNSDEAEFTLGHGDVKSDGYNIMFTGSYTRQNELQAPQRGFSAPGFDPAGGYYSTNNPGSWPGTFLDANGNFFQANYPACTGNPYLTTYFGNCAYRYSTATDLIPESHEASAMLAITKSLPSNNELKLQYFYTRSELTAWSGPMFYAFQMNPSSPYYPTASSLTCVPALGSANCSLPPDLADGGVAIWSDPNNNRYTGNINSEQRLLLTFSGSNGGWDYNVYGNISQNKNQNLNEAGYPVEFPVAGYNGPVLAPGGVLSNLVNPFGPQSAAGQAYINSTYVDGSYAEGRERRWSLDANGSHALGDIFNSGTPATVALGASASGEQFHYGTTPYNNLVQAATGLSASNVAGDRQSEAAFVELDLPFTKALDLDLSDREDNYSDFGTTNNWKAKTTFKAASFLTLRGTASTGFRAPTLYNLYSPQFIAASSSGTMGAGNPDCPVGGTPVAPFTAASCNTQGLAVYGGNPNLTPEKTQNYDFGFILSPTEDLGITVDYFRVIVKNTIGAVPVQAIYGNPAGFSSYYVLNNTGGLTASIDSAADCTPYTSATCGYIKQNTQNTGYMSTDGVDISIQYAQHTSIGTFREDLEGTAVTQFLVQQYTGGPLLNLVGEYNQLPPSYRWSHNLRADWTSPEKMWSAGLDNRFYSEYIDEFPDGNGNQRHVASYSLVDGYVGMKPTENLSVLFGIKNLFDHNPPFTNAYQNNFSAGYNSLVADPLLRNFYINLKYTF